ncbi:MULTISPECIES: LysR family transcriptional regulator [Photorhabdus]|uniref:LysR family transcriptional regulator n=2 Tax=Morganellaceae TaxID=1903414 RepID=A0ABX0APU0_9GAMM|nr:MULTISPECIES: LysR family transcriptional regulator [Photorhabdus]RAW97188.1 LysR family transcriptional regulator [Photorhabdus sp. S9-53]NDL00913.1 LysR family transcriptional regulator [Photorhabdus bodei]NDL05081.1 LysR family transcriptional regulator [Photorhabdus bodei]NDL09406.1 LysR family transcriptional regulator [Photorhabdus bodei]RAW97133.1 LysR family transcriptional regulator [Photorhabdus sp. S10-54]
MHKFNRSTEMAVFVQVIESESLSAAARKLDMTPSAVSKLINRLEMRLGVRLLNRTTRKLQLTAEGSVFYERSVRILEDIIAAEQEANQGTALRGRIRVNCHVAFGKHCLMPLLPDFLQRYPEITLDISLCDLIVDLLDDRSDVAIRTGPLDDSCFMVRKLGASRMVVVGSPSYLERMGIPSMPSDLGRYNRLGFGFTRHMKAWPFIDSEEWGQQLPSGNLLLGDGETMRKAAIAGLGLARLARFHVDADIRNGLLLPVLENYNPGDKEEIYAVFVGQGRQLPSRIRVFLDYLTERIHIGDGW